MNKRKLKKNIRKEVLNETKNYKKSVITLIIIVLAVTVLVSGYFINVSKKIKADYNLKSVEMKAKIEQMQEEHYNKIIKYEAEMKMLKDDFDKRLNIATERIKRDALNEARKEARDEVNKFIKAQLMESGLKDKNTELNILSVSDK